jgi:hypothetical protein
MSSEQQRIDLLTIIGLGMLLMPSLTMWHEIGGHAAFCAAQGGHVATIGAFYVECTGLTGAPMLLVACAGVLVDTILTCIAYALWKRARGDRTRLVLWLIWVTKGFVAAGYFCFSGASGVGDLGPTADGGLGALAMPWLWRAGELAFGIAAYVLLVRAAIRTLTRMLGDSRATATARRIIAHGYYATIGVAAVLVGLLNPVGIFITIMSAAASSFGGNAGMISVGYAAPHGTTVRPFTVARNWPIIMGGAVLLAGFALILGPSLRFPG